MGKIKSLTGYGQVDRTLVHVTNLKNLGYILCNFIYETFCKNGRDNR